MTDSLFTSSEGLDPEVVEAARDELRRRLPELRELPGFPIGSDEDILAMSVPPYYTACPNPFLQEWLDASKPDGYDDRDYVDPGPFVSDVSEGKGHAIYKAHSFWTKVPHKAIMRYILHYTKPGDVVLDGFAGSGMTGVAARSCAAPESEFREIIEGGMGQVEWGARRAVLQDLSPAATNIAAGLNVPIDTEAFDAASRRLLSGFWDEWGWMYETSHSNGQTGQIDFTLWSEVFTCSHCGGEVVYFDAAFDEATRKLKTEFSCEHCGTRLVKRGLERRYVDAADARGEIREELARTPVQIQYLVGGDRFIKTPDAADLDTIRRIAALTAGLDAPDEVVPYHYRMMWLRQQRMASDGSTRAYHFYPRRSLAALSILWSSIRDEPTELQLPLKFWIEQAIWGLSWMNRWRPDGYSHVNQYMTGVYYVPSVVAECSPMYNLLGSSPRRGKRASLVKVWSTIETLPASVRVSTGSSASVGVADSSVDYVFVDPPFGSNLYYADLNYLVESWHRVLTDDSYEAIVNESNENARSLGAYGDAMAACFVEFFRVLKPGRWMTVEFSNSSNEVWLSIQEALSYAGFVVADTRILDKQQQSFQQFAAKNAVKRDLIISAYKPSVETVERFSLVGGTPEGAWEFVREHLGHLPVVEGTRGEARVVRERMADRLYDRMVAYHVHRGVTVPLTAAEFYSGLEQRFPVRDDMYFLSEQVEGYERHRMTVKDLVQAELFITNEQSAVQWLRQLLKRKPRTYAEVQPLFFAELQAGLPEWEALPELRDLLESSFLQDDKDRWYVPDPKKSQDLEKLRTKSLLREFEVYLGGKGKLERFRSEAVRAGFRDAWGRRDFATIVTVGSRLPDDAFVEDEALLYYFDNAQRLTP